MAGTTGTRADIPIRRVTPLRDQPIKRDFMDGDPVMSHAVAVLSAMFPNGEDFFVDSVRHYRDRLDDPELGRRVKQFAGQESTHRRAHRELNDRLAGLGFKTGIVDRAVGIGFNQLTARLLPAPVKLAITAALEHYTATLAEVLLEDPRARSLISDDQVRRMLLWHALEESEHKAVAFDVYQAVSGNELLRRAVMDVMTGFFVWGLVIGTSYSAISTASPADIPSYAKGLRRLPRWPFLSAGVVRRLRLYNRSGFHPDLFDSDALIRHWRGRLFGATPGPPG